MNTRFTRNAVPRDAARRHAPGSEYLGGGRRWNVALVVSVTYGAVALVWIFASDAALNLVVTDKDGQTAWQTVKGVAFVAVTALMLFALLHRLQGRELATAARLQEAIDASRDGLWRWDLERDEIVATPGGDTELGWEAAKTIRNKESWQAIVHPDDWARVATELEALQASGGDNWHLQQRFRTRDGGWRWFQIKGTVVARAADGSIAVMEGVYHGIEDLKRAQIRLDNANRALAVLVATYDAMAEGGATEAIFSRLVERIAAWPECAVAWIGVARDDELRRIVPVVSAGPAADFPARANLRWDDSEYGNGPSGTCIKTGRPSLVEDVREDANAKPWLVLLEEHGIRSTIVIPIPSDNGPTYILHIAGTQPQLFPGEGSETYQMISRVLSLTVGSLDAEFRFSMSESARQDTVQRLEKIVRGSITALATVVEKRDPYTAGHQQRVASLAVAFGRELGLDDDRLEGLYIGAWIHDVGKIGVPTEILSKPGRLDEAEINLIRRHADIGYEIVKNIDFGWPVEKIVHQHHERYDGSGYPQGLEGENIAIEARIVAVADVIESMGTDRPYRARIPWNVVMGEIEDGRGTKYDPRVVDAAMVVLDRDAEAFGFNQEATVKAAARADGASQRR